MAQPSYTIYNLYNATLTYQSQAIPSGSTYIPPTTTTQVAFASDISLLGDVGLGYVGINFGSGSGTITGPTAVTALKNLVSLIPVNTLVTSYTADGVGNPITSTTEGTKQRLDVTTGAPLTPSTPTFATVGTSSASALAANSSRKGLVMTNTSTATISLNIVGGTAVLNSGIVLYPGGVWEMDDFTFTTFAIFAIASAASSNLSIQELIT